MTNQKGNTLLGLIIGVILVSLIGGAYYVGTQKNKSTQTTSPVTPQVNATSQPTVQAQTSNEPSSANINGFPIYPGAKLVNKTNERICTPDSLPTLICGNTVYTYESSDDYDHVKRWYVDSHNGWKCEGGGAGSYTDPWHAEGFTNCSNGSLSIKMYIEALPSNGKVTTFKFGTSS